MGDGYWICAVVLLAVVLSGKMWVPALASWLESRNHRRETKAMELKRFHGSIPFRVCPQCIADLNHEDHKPWCGVPLGYDRREVPNA